MPWLQLDVNFPEHPKLARVKPQDGWLYVAALCYCARLLTDGQVPKDQVRQLTKIREPKSSIDRLLDVGLWTDEGDHYLIHDYLEHQTSRAEVEAKREAAKARMRKLRSPDVRANKGKRSRELRHIEKEVDVQIPPSPQTAPMENPMPLADALGKLNETRSLL